MGGPSQATCTHWAAVLLAFAVAAATATTTETIESAAESAVSAAAGAVASVSGLGASDDHPCSCSGVTAAAAAASAAAPVPLPPPSVSGVSPEGVYFIPDPLPAGETARGCRKRGKQPENHQPQQQHEQQQHQEDATEDGYEDSMCPPADSLIWPHASPYTARILFTPAKPAAFQRGEEAKTEAEEETEAEQGSETETEPKGEYQRQEDTQPDSPDSAAGPPSFDERLLQDFATAQQEVRQKLPAERKKKTSPQALHRFHQQKQQEQQQDQEQEHEGLCRRGRAPSYEDRRRQFIRDFSADYSIQAEETAQRELKRLQGDIYLDYAGSSLYQEQQILSVFKDLGLHTFGNAHSRNPSAKFTDERTREARELTLDFFGAREEEFAVVFTSGATAAIKLVGEDFPFSSASRFYYLRINHNSVLGVRELAYAAGAKAVKALSAREVEETLRARERQQQQEAEAPRAEPSSFCLFGFPLKDNFNGASFPLSWIQRIHKVGLSSDCRWLVLLDAAAAAPTSRIQLSGGEEDEAPDFLALSFYKIFGYPTGLGALILKRSAADVLKKVYWGGGSVSGSLCDARWQKPKADISARLEDGTAIGMEAIERHVGALTRHLYRSLKYLRHRNGAYFALLYWAKSEEPSGGIVNFNLLRPDGSFIPFGEVEAKTAAAGIHLRTGCFCNPGGCQDFLGLTGADIVNATLARESCSDPSGALIRTTPQLGWMGSAPLMTAKASGSVRVSLGYLSTFADVDGLVEFLTQSFLWQ
ncbi:molybdopterin cofactor sulfurase, putative [Eimeria maxima]|uniref:Molybdopterin cofactor sulfurase, putative n=1 Tax=Eimeria maxima TaxID=5804 RepID=U6M9X8_EIMMA|nr:molybdopterin cofactor sulfurase, putative [Eimeria maxima]CDJ59848.1 molybdopterin cofactor sulfurase, putative [Eimeria maxima]